MSTISTRRIDANGLSFAIDEAGAGDDVALLLHGFPESRLAWRKQMPVLAELGWRVVAPDMRGYADSSRPEGVNAYHVDKLTADVAALFDALGAKRRLLIGHDWGGMVAWAAAAMKVTPLDGLIVMNAPNPGVYGKLVKRSLSQMMSSWYVMFFQMPGLPEAALKANGGRAIVKSFTDNIGDPSAVPPDVLEAYRTNILKPGVATTMINYYRANTDMVWNNKLKQTVTAPTLLIWGEKDFALHIRNTEGNEQFVDDFTLARVPGASHWVQYDAAAQVNEAMAAWLNARGLGRGRAAA